MKKNMLRIMCVLLSALLLISVFPLTGFAATSYKIYDADRTMHELTYGVDPTEKGLAGKVYWYKENSYSQYWLVLDGYTGSAITATGANLPIIVRKNSTLTGGTLAPGSVGYGACIATDYNVTIKVENGATLTLNADAVKAEKQQIVGIYAVSTEICTGNGKVVINSTSSVNGACYGVRGALRVGSAELEINTKSTSTNATRNYGVYGTATFEGSPNVKITVDAGYASQNSCVYDTVYYKSGFSGNTCFVNGGTPVCTDGSRPALTNEPNFAGITDDATQKSILRYGNYKYSVYGVSKKASTGSASITAAKIAADLEAVRPQVGKPLEYELVRDDYVIRLSWSDGKGGSYNGQTAKENTTYLLSAYILPLTNISVREDVAEDFKLLSTGYGTLAKYAWMLDSLTIAWGNLTTSQKTQAKNGTYVSARYKVAQPGNAPTLTAAETTIRAVSGEAFNLSVTAKDCTSVIWEKKLPGTSVWSTVKVGTQTTLTDTLSGTFDGTVYRVTGKAPGYADAVAEITVKEDSTIEITQQPADMMYNAQGKASFTVKATGKYELTYKWYQESKSGSVSAVSTQTGPTKFSGMTTDTLEITAGAYFMAQQGYKFYCEISDKTGSVKTEKVSVLAPAAITITQQPANATIKGGAVSFSVKAESEKAITYTWYAGDQALANKTYNAGYTVSGADTDTLTIKNTIPFLKSIEYSCVLTNADGTKVTTAKVKITDELHTITIKKAPVSATVNAGATATFSIEVDTAAEAQPVTYEWYMDGTKLVNRTMGDANNQVMGADTATLSILYVTKDFADGAKIYAVATNADGEKVTSDTVTLTVTAQAFKKGDIDDNGEVTVADARLALRAAIKLTDAGYDFTNKTSREFKAADVDASGDISVNDARSILRVSIKLDSFD